MRTYRFPSLDTMYKHLATASKTLPIAAPEQRRYICGYTKKMDISAEASPIHVRCSGEALELYLSGSLCARLSNNAGCVQLTEFGMVHFDKQIKAGQQASVEGEFASLALSLLSLAVAIDSGRLHERSRLRVPFCEVIQVDELKGLLVKLYETGSEDYQVHEQQDGFLVFNSFTRREDYLPSAMYPMPNYASPRLFYSGNTRPLNDNDRLGALFDSAGVARQLGRAYSTVDEELRVLHQAGYDSEHSIEYYCGWASSWFTTVWTHHAWLVVDGSSVIDLTAEKIGPITEMPKRARAGQVPVYDQTELAAKLKAFEAEHHSTKELISYGKCDGWCYVGVPSNADEGILSFRALLDKYPHHPSYMNVDKQTFTNRLNRAYYGKG